AGAGQHVDRAPADDRARGAGGRQARIDDAPGRQHDLQWSGIALEVRDLLACDAFEHEVHGGFDEGARTIDGTAYLRRRPAPVDSELVADNRDRDLQRQWLRILAETVEIISEAPGAVGQC